MHFRNSNFENKMKRLHIPKKNLRTRNCRRKFIKNQLPEKRKDNM